MKISDLQKKLGVEADNVFGKNTADAIIKYAKLHSLVPIGFELDARSAKNLKDCDPNLAALARVLLYITSTLNLDVKCICGMRTYAEQNALYAQGRSTSGQVVTNARGGYSFHNFGVAFDVGIFESGQYLDESVFYSVVGLIGETIGLEWGGRWKNIQDEPHYQLRNLPSLAELREKHG